MLNYLHDIRNKITIINAHTAQLSRKYHDDDINVIMINLMRINDLVNDAYKEYKHGKTSDHQPNNNVEMSLKEFACKIDLIMESLALSFPLEIQSKITPTTFNKPNSKVTFNVQLLMQVIENAVDNSLKASSSKLTLGIQEEDEKCVVELIDNGSGICQQTQATIDSSVIPHGLGKKFMLENMTKMNGNIEWCPRRDGSGMIVRLHFPLDLS